MKTVLPDFHRTIETVFKTTLQRLLPKIYRDYSNFNNDMFLEYLFNELPKTNVKDLNESIQVCMNSLNNQKYTRERILLAIITIYE